MAESRVRLSVPLSGDVHHIFTRLSEASGASLGSTIAQWLEDTLEAAEMATLRLEKLRAMPRESLLALLENSIPIVDALGDSKGAANGREALDVLKKAMAGGSVRGVPRARTPAVADPGGEGAPSSNTGLKVAQSAKKRGSK